VPVLASTKVTAAASDSRFIGLLKLTVTGVWVPTPSARFDGVT
jgi:hypothetical protein